MRYLKDYNDLISYKESVRHKWTKSECEIEASKYKTRNEFAKRSRNAYQASIKNGWLDEISSHMVSPYKLSYWTKETCREEALKYKTRRQFMLNSRVAYNKSIKNGWLNEICSHMKTDGNKYKRCIYAIEFPDNKVYIGLTYNINRRLYQHLSDVNSTVFKYKKISGLDPIIRQLSDYIDVDDASKLESDKLSEYLKNGWISLNMAKCGSVGGKFIKWTKENCSSEALRYNTRNEFKKGSPLAYHAARRNKWMDEICSHMTFSYEKDRLNYENRINVS